MKKINYSTRNKIPGFASLIFAVLLLAVISGCSKDNPVQPSANNFSFSAAADNGTTGMNPQNVLKIKEAKVMIKDLKIDLEKEGGSEEDEDINIGPFVINLSMDSKLNLITSTQLPAGNYEKVKFQIHKLQENEILPDPDFSDANGRYSVVVKGSFNGADFVYKSNVTANQKVNLQKTLNVAATISPNITFYAAPYDWFYDDNGNLLDPLSQISKNIIDHNIRDNLRHQIRVFVDCDRDGNPDN
jgi:hypothetical protein